MNQKTLKIALPILAVVLLVIVLLLALTQCSAEEGNTATTGEAQKNSAESTLDTGLTPSGTQEEIPPQSTEEEIEEPPQETAGDPTCAHVYKDVSVPATCTSKGYVQHTCELCGKSYSDNVVEALGHSYGSYTTVRNATCDTNGSKTRTCSTCGKVDAAVIAATGHKWDAGVMTGVTTGCSAGSKTYTCTVCKQTKTEMLNATHTWGAWQYEEYTWQERDTTRPNPNATYTAVGH